MSFMLTTPQFRDRTKDVTRRLGWDFLRPGELVCGVEKGQGLKKGERIVRLGVIRIKSVRKERLLDITDAEVVREGFPGMDRVRFIAMFCLHNGCHETRTVNRIEFEYA